MQAQILIQQGTARRGLAMLQALAKRAPIPVVVRNTYVPGPGLLVTYGTGHEVRRPWWQQHVAAGGRCIGLDLGYWDREEPDAAMRVTLDDDHPPQWIRPEAAARWDARAVPLREAAGAGPALLIGQGVKAVRVRREQPLQWERRQVERLRALGHAVMYRPKRPTDPVPAGVTVSRHGTIDEALQGVSLVVCRHSNVSVDACLAGVPVACEGGAASALYGSDLCNPTRPTPAQRLEFLRSLAWWNWRPSEARQAWSYLLDRIQCG